ncbi:MAG: YcaO-like family protein [Myxococcales bacterium]|nr:YcaO-like family protein [Myxococcales bacterium]
MFEPQLPDGWAPPQLIHDSIAAAGLLLHRVGVATQAPTGEEVTGAAVETGAAPIARGFYELLERVSTMEAIAASASFTTRLENGDSTGATSPREIFLESADPSRWRYARSNGVAIHDSWARACERALLELIERDRVLRAWYGETSPIAIEMPSGTALDGLNHYDLHAVSFPRPPHVELGRGIEVVGVFGFPEQTEAPLLLGFGARRTRAEALGAAATECLQALGFLWGEAFPVERPALGPTPSAHAEALLYPPHHGALRRWLEEGHGRFRRPGSERPTEGATTFTDLTPCWLRGMFVAKATSPQALPLAFGDSPFVQHLPTELRAHPIA